MIWSSLESSFRDLQLSCWWQAQILRFWMSNWGLKLELLFQNFFDTVQIHYAESIRKSANGLSTSVPLSTFAWNRDSIERLMEVGEPFADFGILFKVGKWVADFNFCGGRTVLGWSRQMKCRLQHYNSLLKKSAVHLLTSVYFAETGVQIAKSTNGVPTSVQIMNSTELDIPFADFIRKFLWTVTMRQG